jgi:hypothetical protein
VCRLVCGESFLAEGSGVVRGRCRGFERATQVLRDALPGRKVESHKVETRRMMPLL